MDNKDLIIKILNVFENDSESPETDYTSVYCYHDGPKGIRQLTLSRGYTEEGTLWDVFQNYKEIGGAAADKLLSYKHLMCKGILPNDIDFINLVKDCAKNDPLFRKAQDNIYDKLYWNKGLDYFNTHKFILPLSLAVIQDSILHSGSILSFLVNRFPERKPDNGGDEKIWIDQYLKARLDWLGSISELLSHTVYRPKFFLEQIKNNNWELNPPFIVNGIKIN